MLIPDSTAGGRSCLACSTVKILCSTFVYNVRSKKKLETIWNIFGTTQANAAIAATPRASGIDPMPDVRATGSPASRDFHVGRCSATGDITLLCDRNIESTRLAPACASRIPTESPRLWASSYKNWYCVHSCRNLGGNILNSSHESVKRRHWALGHSVVSPKTPRTQSKNPGLPRPRLYISVDEPSIIRGPPSRKVRARPIQRNPLFAGVHKSEHMA